MSSNCGRIQLIYPVLKHTFTPTFLRRLLQMILKREGCSLDSDPFDETLSSTGNMQACASGSTGLLNTSRRLMDIGDCNRNRAAGKTQDSVVTSQENNGGST